MKQRLCEWGNCEIECSTVSIVDANVSPNERPSFCGRYHAALWLIAREGHRELARQLDDAAKVPGKWVGVVAL